MRYSTVAGLIFSLLLVVEGLLAIKEAEFEKRDIQPEWNDLGWAWGKRSLPDTQIPQRLLRSLRPMKKNPDWHDLGWTWGRRR